LIFVTIGTTEPFDRLMRAVDAIEGREEIVVQRGTSSFAPRRATIVDFLPYERLVELVREARVVVTHAGVGTILTALLNGARPLVVPRLKTFGDAVDDHQLELASRLEQLGLVILVEEPSSLPEAVATAIPEERPIHVGEALVSELRAFITASTP
jgi:UDP-N-acetylglucosamine transferase subunit ALG13